MTQKILTNKTMNIFKRLFKKRITKKEAEKAYNRLHSLPTISFAAAYSMFPKLTKSELIALQSCIDFTLSGAKTIGVEHNLRKTIYMKRLTDKGYLVRVMKGHYSLSFYR